MIGGDGDSHLFGDAGPNRLIGGHLAGRDGDDDLQGGPLLTGGRGDDILTAGRNALLLDGGPGDDNLNAPNGAALVRCGSGVDHVRMDTTDLIRTLRPNACERVQLEGSRAKPLVVILPARFSGVVDRLTLLCPKVDFPRSCRMTVKASDATGRVVGTAKRAVAPGTRGALTLQYPRRVDARGIRRRIDARGLHVGITIARDGAGSEVIRLALLLEPVRKN